MKILSNVAFGRSAPRSEVDIQGTDSLIVPVGSTAERNATPAQGAIRYNTTLASFEGFNGTDWQPISSLSDVDLDTKIIPESSPGSDEDQLSFYTSGTQQCVITTTGNLGVGIDAPTEKFEVDGNIKLSADSDILFNGTAASISSNATSSIITINASNQINISTGGNNAIVVDNAGNCGIGIDIPATSVHIYDGYTRCQESTGPITDFKAGSCVSSGTDFIVDVTGTNKCGIKTNGTEHFTVTSGGNCGIGNINPNASLHVKDNTTIPSALLKLENSTALVSINLENNLEFKLTTSSASTAFVWGDTTSEKFKITSSGYVGIGVENPTTKLDVAGNIHSTQSIQTDTSVVVGTELQTNIIVTKSLSDTFVLNTNSVDRFKVDSSGNVYVHNKLGIGVPAPDEIFHTKGNVKVDGGSITIGDTFGGAQATINYTVATSKLNIDKDINVSATGTSNFAGDVAVAGDLTVQGTITAVDVVDQTTDVLSITNTGTSVATTINQTGVNGILDVQDNGTSVLYVADGGNVGLGKTNPNAKLDINSGNIKVDSGYGVYLNTNSELRFNTNGDTVLGSDTDISFKTAGTQAATIKANGNVGVGIDVPTEKVHIVGNLRVDGSIISSQHETYDPTEQTVGIVESVVDSFAITDTRSTKYLVQVKNASGSEYQTSELIVIHNDLDAFVSEYGLIHTGSDIIASYSVAVAAGNVELKCVATEDNSKLKLTKTSIKV